MQKKMGAMAMVSGGCDSNNGGRLTFTVVITCIVAASGGLIFGYDTGISGGVSTMPAFLDKFFPTIMENMAKAERNVYCVYNSHALTAFTSSLHLAGCIASLLASRFCSAFGRKATMLFGGFTFFIGGILTGASLNLPMLILGRLVLGFGVGFNNQATPLYLSEMAPSNWRGAANTGFHLFNGFGVVIAGIMNYNVQSLEWGWRLSLGFAIVPALIMMIGIFMISDSPSSLIERGRVEEAKKTLIKVRGESNVDAELADLIKAGEMAREAKDEPLVTIFQRQYRPHLTMAVAIPFFQQVSGIVTVAFYGPAILASLGAHNDAALMAAIMLGGINILSILVSTYTVDRSGRRILLLQGGIQMFVSLMGMALILALTIGSDGTQPITKNHAVWMLVLMCVFGAAFGWSWGPLTWIIPSEIFPLKLRPMGQSISVAVNLGTTFVLSQTFLSMLCSFAYGVFLFYAAWLVVMTVFVALLLPETKGIPLNSIHVIWEKHWFWQRFVQHLQLQVANNSK